ncbi:NAD(P)H-binding protein [Nitrosopumilus sp. K4]|uniref:NAD(P)H-binding protein n=1 Tax=Nitrosopumilus sp. K4 TaxID=2795383 RepID=UPI001BA57C1C|nr:NAD(P)H-binding protein [Nitrosopumilus sp. K4]QUC65737.1 NAD(P)H-binding protein [Nitrosopumilus sp. K4]
MTRNLKIVVTGASGFVGKNLRKFLAKNNIDVVSISRNNFKKLKNETKIITKNYDEKIILPKIKNASALIHLVGIGKQTVENDYSLINHEFTKKIINICKKARIKKIVFNSGLGVSKNTTLGYFISKYKAEQEIIHSELDYTIFRPSYIVGKNDLFTKYLKSQIKKGTIEIPGSGKYSIQPIFINDVSKIILKSVLEKQFKNQILDLVGPNSITYEKYVTDFSHNSGTKIKKISLESAYYNAISNPKSKFGVDDLNLLVGNFKGNYNKLEKLSKMKFQSIHEVLKSGILL